MGAPWRNYGDDNGPWAKYRPAAEPEINTDPTAGMSDWEKRVAGVGSTLSRNIQGVKQRLGMISEQEVAETRERDKPLLEGGSSALEPLQTGRLGVRDVPRPWRVSRGPGAQGALIGDVIPLAALSAIAPGANTILGSTALGAIRGLTEPTAPGESVGKNVAAGAAIGGGSAAAIKGAGMATSKLMAGQQAEGAAAASRNAVMDETLKAARAEGYVIPASADGGGFLSKRLESIGGKAAVGQEAALRNQQVTNKIARRESGLTENEPISEKSLADARDKMSGPYRRVAAIDPEAKASLEELQTARADAKDWWKRYNVSSHPDDKKKALSLDNKAKNLETYIDDIAKNSGDKNLVSELREARRNLAKNYDVEKALNIGSGDVDAHIIGRMLDKSGNRMSEGLKTIGRFAEAFGPYTRPGASIPTPGVSKSEALSSVLFGMGGHAAIGPAGAAAAALPLLSGPARAIALSKLAQRPNTYGPGKAMSLADIAANSEATKRLLPAAGVGAMNME